MSKGDVFFDFDMTLGYRITMWRATVRELLLEECVVCELEDIRPFSDTDERGISGYPWNRPDLSHEEFFAGKGWWENSQEFIRRNLTGICSDRVAQRVAKRFPARFCDMRYWRLFPDSVDALCSLSAAGYDTHILSNHVPEAREIITALGLGALVKSMTLSAEVGYEKPHPAIFAKAKENAHSDFLVMIGDHSVADVKGAEQNGMIGILARRKAEECPLFVPDLKNITQTVEKLRESRMGKRSAICD